MKGLETFCEEKIISSLTNADSRYLNPTHKEIDDLDFDTAVKAIKSQLRTDTVEVR